MRHLFYYFGPCLLAAAPLDAFVKYVIGILTTTSLHTRNGQPYHVQFMHAIQHQRQRNFRWPHSHAPMALTRTHAPHRTAPMECTRLILYLVNCVNGQCMHLSALHGVDGADGADCCRLPCEPPKCRYGWDEFIQRRRRIQCAFPLE